MNGTTHKIGGICTGIVAATEIFNAQPETIFIVTTASLIGSLFPDIDEPNSMFGRKIRLFSGIIKKIFGHRGIIHTPLTACLLSYGIYKLMTLSNLAIVSSLAYQVSIGFLVGYLTHLILDAITPQGIMFLFPITKHYFTIFKWRSKNRDLYCSLIISLATILWVAKMAGMITFS